MTETKVISDDIQTTKQSKKNRFFGFLGRNWSWILSATITAVFMLVLMIAGNVKPFGDRSFTMVDSIHQYIPFFSDYQGKLKAGESLFFTWDVGLGQNFLSLLLYYMASPLNLILFLVSRKSIVSVFCLLVAFKIVFSAGAFSFMLSRRKGQTKNNSLMVAMGLGYAISNYICGYLWNIMWLDCIMVFPLIILGFDRLMEKRDPRLYIVALFYSLFTNYYISFMICIFLILWFLATSHKNVKQFIRDGLCFAGCSLLAAGMAALSLIIAYIAIMQTSSAGRAMPGWNWYQNIFELLKSHFFLTKPIKMDNFDGKANLFCGTLSLMLLFVYAFSNRIRPAEKIRKLVLVAFLIISMNQEILNFIWHGFHDQFGIPNRFAFLYIFTILYLGYEAIVKIRRTNIALVVAGLIATCVLMGICYVKTDFNGVVSNKYMLILSYSLIVVYGVLLILRTWKIMSIKVSNVVLGIIMAAELIVNASVGIATNGLCDAGYYLKYSDVMEETVAEVNSMAENKGLKFYRQDIIEPIMMNENTYDGMKSLGTFCSTANGKVVNTMAYYGYYTGENEYLFRGANPVTNDMFGIRYIYVRDGDFCPYKSQMKEVAHAEGLTVYENETALPIAFGVKNNIDRWSCGSYNAASVLGHFAQYATGSDEVFKVVQPVYSVSGTGCDANYNYKTPEVISYSGGTGKTISVSATFIVVQEGDYYLNCRANYLENLEYILNGKKMTSGRNHGQTFNLGELKKDDTVTLNMRFNERYTAQGTISMYMSTLDKDALTDMRANLIKNQMLVSEVKEDYIKGEVNLAEDQVLFTTIPYDEGWSAYVDGEKTEIKKVGGAFIRVDAGPGNHTVEFKYVPQGFALGLIISIISWIAFIVICVFYRKRRKDIEKSN